MNEDAWMWPPSSPPPPPPFPLPARCPNLPSSPPHFLRPWQAAFLYVLLHSRTLLWLWMVCITHIAVSTTPPLGRPYKGLSFLKVKSEPCTQVLSRHLVWKNKIGLLLHPCPVTVCLQWLWLPKSLRFFSSYQKKEQLSVVCMSWKPAVEGKSLLFSILICLAVRNLLWIIWSSRVKQAVFQSLALCVLLSSNSWSLTSEVTLPLTKMADPDIFVDFPLFLPLISKSFVSVY